MPSIDYATLRKTVSLSQVLDLMRFEPIEHSGDERRGPCPIHHSTSPNSRSFSANVAKNTFQCFSCGAARNQLDLWALAQQQPIYEAALDLCERLGVSVPQLARQAAPSGRTEKRSP